MKKLFFTGLVAIVAVGGAYASYAANANARIIEGKPYGSSAPCDITVPCHPAASPNCSIDGVEYAYEDTSTGLCTLPLERD